jgi:hypothetical protein
MKMQGNPIAYGRRWIDASRRFVHPYTRSGTKAYAGHVMLSAAGEFLRGALSGLNAGLCPACAANMMGCMREDMVKATKELISHGLALAELAVCDACQKPTLVARLRSPRQFL